MNVTRPPAAPLSPGLARLAAVLAACLSAVPCLLQAQPAPAASTGTVEGVVRYRADAARPWKFARYYVKDAKAGLLAESVAALESPALAAWPASTTSATIEVDQLNFNFVPETTAIRAGDSVRFKNSDDSVHNVMTSDGGAPFNVNMGKGDDYSHTFKTAGGIGKPVRLGCVYHGGMRAWVYVFGHPFFQVTPPTGAFRFAGVPPGDYTLEIVHPAGHLRASRTVSVQAGKTSTLEVVLGPDDLIGADKPAPAAATQPPTKSKP